MVDTRLVEKIDLYMIDWYLISLLTYRWLIYDKLIDWLTDWLIVQTAWGSEEKAGYPTEG